MLLDMPRNPPNARANGRQWYTPTEAAKALGMDASALQRRVRSGRVPAVRTGVRAWHLTAETVLALAKQRP